MPLVGKTRQPATTSKQNPLYPPDGHRSQPIIAALKARCPQVGIAVGRRIRRTSARVRRTTISSIARTCTLPSRRNQLLRQPRHPRRRPRQQRAVPQWPAPCSLWPRGMRASAASLCFSRNCPRSATFSAHLRPRFDLIKHLRQPTQPK